VKIEHAAVNSLTGGIAEAIPAKPEAAEGAAT